MSKFTTQNTEGYNDTELSELNEAWAQITSHGGYTLEDSDDSADLSMLDHWSECLLAAYDHGKRGADLVAWFYE